ncbi:MAG: pantoate--beta-alanine ligase, partial [Candidatus Pelagibacter sp.]
AKKLISFKKKGSGKHDLKKILNIQKNKFNRLYNIRIEYLELRNKNNLKITNKIRNAKIFIAYLINNVRLIDNF